MSLRRVVPNITCSRLDESRKFYTDFLGFHVAMDLGWIVTLVSPSNSTAQISLVRGEPSEPVNQNITVSIEVADVDELHARAVASAYNITYPLTTEQWGVRRFHVTDPNGVTLNVMSHRNENTA